MLIQFAVNPGDGETNGQELGDPCCVWIGQGNPSQTLQLSDPSDHTSVSESEGCTIDFCPGLEDQSLDHSQLALQYTKLGNHECALQHRKVDQEIHNDVDSLFNLAEAFERVGDMEDALKTWAKAARAAPNDEEIQAALQDASKRLSKAHNREL
jgi:tetratricopeptide (TPR) repeat protein